MSSALTSWKDAERACFNYLIEITDSTEGDTAWLGDSLPAYTMNIFAFNVSGGPTQTQNFQRAAPCCQWIANGVLIGQFAEREYALDFAGKIMNRMPAYKNDDNNPSGSPAERGLAPNVNLFEMTEFPVLDSRPLLTDSEDDEEITVWMLLMNFRVEFGNEQN